NRANDAVRVLGYRDSTRLRSFAEGRPEEARTNPRSSSNPVSGSVAFRWQETVIGVTSAKVSTVITSMAEFLCALLNLRGVGLDIGTPGRMLLCATMELAMGLMGLLTKG